MIIFKMKTNRNSNLKNMRYELSLNKTAKPLMPHSLPKVKMNLAGLSRYAKEKVK